MKLPIATSFFLFAIFLMVISACESEVVKKRSKSPEIVALKKKVKEFRKRNDYDNAIVCQNELIAVAGRLRDSSSIQFGYFTQYTNYREIGNTDSMFLYLQKWYDISERLNDTRWMASASRSQGTLLEREGEFQEAFNKFSRAKKLYLQINDTIRVASILSEIAYLQKKQGNFGASQLSALEGLNYVENTNELKTLGGLYHVLSVASRETGNTDMAIERIDQALKLVEDSIGREKIDAKSIIQFKNTKANIYKELEEFDNAIQIYEELLVDKSLVISMKESARINGNLAHTLFLKNGFNKRSDSLLNNSLLINKEIDYASGLHSTYLKLAELYKDEDKERSIEFVNRAITYARDLVNKKAIHEGIQMKIVVALGNEYVNEYMSLDKELEQKEEELGSLFANERYNYNKAENEKIIVENKANKAEKDKALSQNIVLILIILLIVLIVVIYFIYQKIKRRHKIEKVKTVHVTEARISSKVHDELANDLYKLISQLETTDPEKETILDKLDVIYNQARDISKQIQGVETGEGFAEELSNLFRSYQSEEVNVLLKRYNIDIWNGISSHIKITVYRVLQELLTNMKKHSNAVLVVVSIEKNNKQLFIQYIDNGKGFAEEISKNGLQNAENRIHAIEGTLTFDTELHKGCKFSINVPV
ncbi:hypothetical protein H2O64_12450 [Kordia sp. YSTF-M3]|uniref:histidine kinase n=1 Tax=Kordia aestuariivivens TaxID=2759037 RepID=A0ABR7QAY1_9FLAO|nr:ATP-binding protein [Kordia aestuariivivens]MBC8755479.1 hypothetical protein [Kordia aestuariivivens]